jgi:hypothetical protein
MDEKPTTKQTPEKSTDKFTLALEGAEADSGMGRASGIERRQFPQLLAFLFLCTGSLLSGYFSRRLRNTIHNNMMQPLFSGTI